MKNYANTIRFKSIVYILLVSLLLFTIASCVEKGIVDTWEEKGIVGTWQSQEGYTTTFYTFNSNGSGFYKGDGFSYPLTYEIDGNKLF